VNHGSTWTCGFRSRPNGAKLYSQGQRPWNQPPSCPTTLKGWDNAASIPYREVAEGMEVVSRLYSPLRVG